eukprot:scaffold41671_cov46-Attheya_sp.AAC.2
MTNGPCRVATAMSTAETLHATRRSERAGVIRSHPEQDHDGVIVSSEDSDICEEENALLEEEEEKMMLMGDEEIDESEANDDVETENEERRMLTVALVTSVMETSGGRTRSDSGNSGNSAVIEDVSTTDDKEKAPTKQDMAPGSPKSSEGSEQSHRYGLRKRTRSQSFRGFGTTYATKENEAETTDSQKDDSQEHEKMGIASISSTCVKTEDETIAVNPAPSETFQSTLKVGNDQATKIESKIIKTEESCASAESVKPKCSLNSNEESKASNGAVTVFKAAALKEGQTTTVVVKEEQSSAARIKRARIFSIDLDPAGFDFDSRVIELGNYRSGQMNKDSTALLPPIANGMSATRVSTQVAMSSSSQQENPPSQNASININEVENDFAVFARGRGMSMDFFFMNEDEPLPPAPTLSDLQGCNIIGDLPLSDAMLRRPRGESIIYDPVSFSEGGILEEKANLRVRSQSIQLEGHDEFEMMNAPGFVYGPMSAAFPPGTDIPAVISVQNKRAISLPKVNRPDASSGVTNQGSKFDSSRQPSAMMNGIKPISSKFLGSNMHHNSMRHTHVNSPLLMHNTTIQSTLSGTNVNCSMELLNKGGRIGIYLPEARRARIAKFHSKRKMRIWRKRIKYDCRKKLADSRPRIKGRFVKRSDMDEEEF